MKTTRTILLFLIGLFFVLLDVSFLSTFELFGATIISSYLALTILAISDSGDDYVVFALSLVILFAVFTSLPLLVIATNFVLVPLLLNFIMRKYFRIPNRFTALAYFLAATFLFELFLVLWSGEANADGLLLVYYFVVLNSIAGFLLNLVFLQVRGKLRPGKEIKI